MSSSGRPSVAPPHELCIHSKNRVSVSSSRPLLYNAYIIFRQLFASSICWLAPPQVLEKFIWTNLLLFFFAFTYNKYCSVTRRSFVVEISCESCAIPKTSSAGLIEIKLHISLRGLPSCYVMNLFLLLHERHSGVILYLHPKRLSLPLLRLSFFCPFGHCGKATLPSNFFLRKCQPPVITKNSRLSRG